MLQEKCFNLLDFWFYNLVFILMKEKSNASVPSFNLRNVVFLKKKAAQFYVAQSFTPEETASNNVQLSCYATYKWFTFNWWLQYKVAKPCKFLAKLFPSTKCLKEYRAHFFSFQICEFSENFSTVKLPCKFLGKWFRKWLWCIFKKKIWFLVFAIWFDFDEEASNSKNFRTHIFH